MITKAQRRHRVVVDITLDLPVTQGAAMTLVQEALSRTVGDTRVLSYERVLHAHARRDNRQLAHSLYDAAACIADARRLLRQGRIDL